MAEAFDALLTMYNQRAEEYIEQIRDCPPELRSHAFLHQQLLGYVRSKFMLDPTDCNSEVLTELSEASIAKVASIPKGDLANRDISMSCAGISSVETKRILLLIALQRSLGIRIAPDITPSIQTADDLTNVVSDGLSAL